MRKFVMLDPAERDNPSEERKGSAEPMMRVRNFCSFASAGPIRRESVRVARSACATTSSGGGKSSFIARSQLWKVCQIVALKDRASYCSSPWAIQPSMCA